MAVDRRGHSAGDVGAHRGSWGLHRERRWSPRVCGDIFTLRLAHAPATDKVTLRNIDERILVEDDTERRENPHQPPHLGLLHALGLLSSISRGAGAWAAFGLKMPSVPRSLSPAHRRERSVVGTAESCMSTTTSGQRPGKKSHHHRCDGFRSDDSDGGGGSDGEGAHDRSGGGPRDSARDRRARGRSVASTTRDVKRRQSREPERSRVSLTRRD